ncbi:MAG: hypothetical protein KGZ79_07030 [Dethiobacter sp.]|jgi:hypothetical protein|nr:hypothetical protein [Dethiobacter sp.]
MNLTKMVAAAMFFLILSGLAGGCGNSGDSGPNNGAAPRRQVEKVNPPGDDGAIYSAAGEFVQALVSDDRDKVLFMLTVDHRNSWQEDSFLFRQDAKAGYEEFVLENLNYSVVAYLNNEQTGFTELAVIDAVYDVVMKNGGEEAVRVSLQDTLAFRRESGQWLISVNERIFVADRLHISGV